MGATDVIGTFFLIVGAFFTFVGSLGVLRMPDVFNKLQAGTKATTLGFLSIGVGMLFLQPSWALKIILIMAFVLVTNPIGSHALARSAQTSAHAVKDGKGKS